LILLNLAKFFRVHLPIHLSMTYLLKKGTIAIRWNTY